MCPPGPRPLCPGPLAQLPTPGELRSVPGFRRGQPWPSTASPVAPAAPTSGKSVLGPAGPLRRALSTPLPPHPRTSPLICLSLSPENASSHDLHPPNWAQWHTPVIPAHGMLRQMDHLKFKANVSYIGRSYLKTNKQNFCFPPSGKGKSLDDPWSSSPGLKGPAPPGTPRLLHAAFSTAPRNPGEASCSPVPPHLPWLLSLLSPLNPGPQ